MLLLLLLLLWLWFNPKEPQFCWMFFFPGSEDGASIAPSGMGTEDHWDAWSLSKTSGEVLLQDGPCLLPSSKLTWQ